MKLLLLAVFVLPFTCFAKIEDNSFLMEEAYNQEWGVLQFIQKYQTSEIAKGYEYSLENEIPITDKTHQFSWAVAYSRQDIENGHGAVGDSGISYRWQPLNRDGVLVAGRFTLLIPTGQVQKGGTGVYGFEFMKAATITLDEKWMSHWNFGFNVSPNGKTMGVRRRRSISGSTAATSLIYLMSENFNILFEALLESGQSVNEDGSKTATTSLTLNPGIRFAMDYDWKDTQIVPGISFPTEMMNGPTEHGVLFYLSFEPKLY